MCVFRNSNAARILTQVKRNSRGVIGGPEEMMIIQKQYEVETGALNDLVEVLYMLLTEKHQNGEGRRPSPHSTQ
jgi:hypothetical protein